MSRLKGSTLVETLIMMIVAAIIFLCVMDGMTLFGRYTTRQMQTILANSALIDGYYRVEQLIAQSDSLVESYDVINIYTDGFCRRLEWSDSMLIVTTANSCDTLFRRCKRFKIEQDSLYLIIIDPKRQSVTIGFAAPPQENELYNIGVAEIEKDYNYE